MSRWRMRAVVIALLAGVGLAGCASDAPVQPVGPVTTEQRPTSAPNDDLEQQRRDAGIADCPASDPDVKARADGLPDVTLTCLGGGDQVRLAGLRGQPMMVNVWAQWCGPCRSEAPFLREAAAQRPDVMLLGIDFDDPDPAAAIAFADQVGWGWPQVADPQKSIAAPLRVIGPPQSFFVAADGRVVYAHRGQFTSTEQVTDLLDEHLG